MFASCSRSRVQTKDHHKKWYKLPLCWVRGYYGRSLAVQPDCVKGLIVCGIVYGDTYYIDLLGSIARVGYLIPVPDL